MLEHHTGLSRCSPGHDDPRWSSTDPETAQMRTVRWVSSMERYSAGLLWYASHTRTPDDHMRGGTEIILIGREHTFVA